MPTTISDSLLVFRVREKAFALPVAAVERVVRAVELAAPTEALGGACGTVDVQGRTVPVFDLTGRRGTAVQAADHLIIAHTPQRTVALLVAAVESVGPPPEGGASVIPDLETFLASTVRAAFSPEP